VVEVWFAFLLSLLFSFYDRYHFYETVIFTVFKEIVDVFYEIVIFYGFLRLACKFYEIVILAISEQCRHTLFLAHVGQGDEREVSLVSKNEEIARMFLAAGRTVA